MGEKAVIFMVEDENAVLAANRRMLERRGYQVEQADCVADAYAYLKEHTPDLMILDIMLPDGSGLDICQKYREKSEKPVLFLTGKTSLDDRIEGLDQGGDYYLTKPYQFAELLAIIKRLLEREEKRQHKEEALTIFRKGDLEVNMLTMTVKVKGVPVPLTGKEFGLLVVLMQNEGKELSGEELYEKVWKTEPGSDVRTIRKHIMNLRNKLCASEMQDYDIVTSYGKGYMFRNS